MREGFRGPSKERGIKKYKGCYLKPWIGGWLVLNSKGELVVHQVLKLQDAKELINRQKSSFFGMGK